MSTGLLYGEVPFVETPEAPPGVTLTWTGADGSVWDLGDIGSGVFLLAGVRGLVDRPPRTRWASESAAYAGTRHLGGRDGEREVFWPLSVRLTGGGQPWYELDGRFARSLDYDTTGTWTVETPNGSARKLDLRLSDDDAPEVEQMPGINGVQHYGIYLVANDPYWRDVEPVVRPYEIAEGEEAFIPVGGAPPFFISQASTVGTASIDNPGDVPAWPTYRITADPTGDGMDGVLVGLDGAQIGIPDLAAGDEFVVDTMTQTATKNGVRVRGVLSPHDFAPIPRRGTSQLALAAVGQGIITVEFTPRYLRAWG